jgi:hypothetical protein
LLAIPEDSVRHESDDEDNVNPDDRNPQSITDKRIAPDNEFSDSEDEGMAPGVGGGGRKDNRYLNQFIFKFYSSIFESNKSLTFINSHSFY